MKTNIDDNVVTPHSVITAQVSPSSGGPYTVGQTGFSLSCVVSGTDNLNSPTLTYQWRRDGSIIPGQEGRLLSLSPLNASSAGQYTCRVTVSSQLLSSDVTAGSNALVVSIQCE